MNGGVFGKLASPGGSGGGEGEEVEGRSTGLKRK